MSTPQDPQDARWAQQPASPPEGYGEPPVYGQPAGYGPPPAYGQPAGYPGAPYGVSQPPPGDPLVPADLGGWFQRIIGVVQRSFVPLLQIELAVAVVSVLTTLLFGPAMTQFTPEDLASGRAGASIGGLALLGALIAGVVAVIGAIASVYVAVTHANGEAPDLGAALRFAPSRFFPFLGWWILAGLIVVVGFVLILVPGLYFVLVFSASLTGVVVIERGGIGRSFTLFNNRFGPTLGRMLLLFLAGLVYGGLTLLLVAVFGQGSVVATILQAVLGIVGSIVGTAVTVVTYAELRFHDRERPGALTPTLAAELHR